MLIEKTQTRSYPEIELIPEVNTTEYKIGQCLSAAGALVTGTTKPEYICAATRTGVTGGMLPVIRVNAGDTYAAKLSASGSSLSVGDKVTIASDGIRVTATTNDGVAEIVAFATSAQASGDVVYVKF